MDNIRFEIYDENENVILDLAHFSCSALGTVTIPSLQSFGDEARDIPVNTFTNIDLKALAPCVESCVEDDIWYVLNPWYILLKTNSDGGGCGYPSMIGIGGDVNSVQNSHLIVKNNKLYLRLASYDVVYWINNDSTFVNAPNSASATYLVGVRC